MRASCCRREEKPIEHSVDSLKSWSVAFGAFLMSFPALGLMYSFGIFMLPWIQEFSTTRAEVSLIGTVNVACTSFSGIFASALSDRYGIKVILVCGLFLWLTGVFASSFCTSLPPLYFTFGVCCGLGTGMMVRVLSKDLLCTNPRRNRLGRR